MITIFTDGSSKGNPGPGGWGAIIVYPEQGRGAGTVVEIGGRDEYTTNNKMELAACIKALESLPVGVEVTLYSDATYVVKGMTEWIHNWMKKNWRTSTKKAVENKDLWMDLYQASVDKKIHWKLIAGHAGVPANERCDEIATTFADVGKIALYNGTRAKYSVRLSF
jgi:ribonuclease HI